MMCDRNVDQILVSAECPALPVKCFPIESPAYRDFRPVLGKCCSAVARDSSSSHRDCSPLSIVEKEGVSCILCSENFSSRDFVARWSEHLLSCHSAVVADTERVSCLSCYCRYWRRRLSHCAITDYCFTIVTNSAPLNKHPSETYYLLSPKLDEDRELRRFLHQSRLQRVLNQQQLERSVSRLQKGCLFCREDNFDSFRAYFLHLNAKHNLSVGRPENIVFAHEFIDTIECKLLSLKCLFCDGEFKERATLKEHMRKKAHKSLNPNNTEYDRFYVVNYLEPGKTWLDLTWQERDDGARHRSSAPPARFQRTSGVSGDDEEDDDDDDDWSAWRADSVQGAVCLFCCHCCVDLDQLTVHMRQQHDFSWMSSENDWRLSFYERVKLVNYIRRQVQQCRCILCDVRLDSEANLLEHMVSQRHSRIPAKHVWNQCQYLLPTFDNDTLLHMLPYDDDDDEDEDTVLRDVVAEDVPDLRQSILADRNVLDELTRNDGIIC